MNYRLLKAYRILAFVLTLSLPSFAFAGIEGPHAAPPNPTLVPGAALAVVRTAGGKPLPNHSNPEFGILVNRQGEVYRFSVAALPDAPKVYARVITLSTSQLGRLKAESEKLPVVEMVREDAEAPTCYDAPSTDYSLYDSKGKQIEVGRVSACVKYRRADYEGEATWEFLQALSDLARYTQ